MIHQQMTIAEAIQEYLEFSLNAKRIKPGTFTRVRSDFRGLTRAIDSSKLIGELTNADVDAWVIAQSLRGVSGRSINSRMGNFKAMIKWMKGMNIEIPNLRVSLLIKQPEKPPRRKCFTWSQVEQALNCADERTWLMISLLYDGGLRLSEMLSLRVENINRRQLHFVGKCDIDSKVVISKRTKRRLNLWLEKNQISEGYIFPGQSKGKHCSVCTGRKHMGKAFKAAGIKGFYPHALRHSFASEVLEKCARIEVVQTMLRHVSIENTRRYAREMRDRSYRNFDKYMHKRHHLNAVTSVKMVLLNLMESATIKLTKSLTRK